MPASGAPAPGTSPLPSALPAPRRVLFRTEGLLRALIVALVGAVGFLLWRVVLHVAAGESGAAYASPPSYAPYIATTLSMLAPALIVSAVVGAGVAFLVAAPRRDPSTSWALGGAAWVVGGGFWLAVSPAVVAGVVAAILPVTALWRVLAIALLGGLGATLVGLAMAGPWCRGRWTAGALAGVCGLARALCVLCGATVPVEVLLDQQGVGYLALQSAGSSQDPEVVAAALTPLLLIALGAQIFVALVGALPLGTESDREVRPPAVRLRGARVVVPLVTLALPLLALLAGAFIGHVPQDLAAVLERPSVQHPLGTDRAGEDVLAVMLLGFRTVFVPALLGAAGACLVGGAWALVALALARLQRVGPALAELCLLPGWVVAVIPLLLAGVAFQAAFRVGAHLPVALVVVILFAPRVAIAFPALRSGITSFGSAVRAVGGLLSSLLGVSLVLLLTLQAVGYDLGVSPADSLGGQIVFVASQLAFPFSNGVPVHAGLVQLLVAPLFLAGWALLAGTRRGDLLGMLQA